MAKILVVGGTRFFGIPMVNALIEAGHDVTIATRGNAEILFVDKVRHIIVDRNNPEQVKEKLGGIYFDCIIDKVAYSSNDVKHLMDYVSCGRYILMSSCSVYTKFHSNIYENEFDPFSYELKWMDRIADYDEGKRQAECAAAQIYNRMPLTFVRYPVVMGPNDYTGRLKFYVDHIRKEIPMFIDDLNQRLSFIHEDEAGRFISHLVAYSVDGAVNGSSKGSISISELISMIENLTGKKAIFSENGDAAPYNGYMDDMTLNTDLADKTGFDFSNINSWIEDLIAYHVN